MTCYARQIYSDVEHLREEMQSIMQGHLGRLSVGMIKGAVLLLTRAFMRYTSNSRGFRSN